MKIYLVGSLKDPDFPSVAHWLRREGYDVFDDWRGSGADGDVRWREYELNERQRRYLDAAYEPYAVTMREFDCAHIDNSDAVVAVCPQGKLPGRSAIAELGYASRRGIPTAILLYGDPAEWDLMLPLVAEIFGATDDLLAWLKGLERPTVEKENQPMSPEEGFDPIPHNRVNHPPHYTSHPSGVECIAVTEHLNFCLGNAVKYLWRADLKGGTEDLEKARWYIDREIARRRISPVAPLTKSSRNI